MEVVTSRQVDREGKWNKETVLRDFVRYCWRATRGLTTVAEAEGRELIRRMTDLGRVSPEEGQRLASTLENRMRHSRDTFEKKVETSVRRAVEKLRDLSSRELSTLEGQATQIEERLEALLSRKKET